MNALKIAKIHNFDRYISFYSITFHSYLQLFVFKFRKITIIFFANPLGNWKNKHLVNPSSNRETLSTIGHNSQSNILNPSLQLF